MNQVWRWMLVLLTVVEATACNDSAAKGTLQPDKDLRPLPTPPLTAASSKASGPSLFEAEPLDRALHDLKQALNRGNEEQEIAVLELRANQHRLLLQAEDPKAPGRVLQWEYSQGKVQEPVVVDLRGEGNLEDNLFSLDGVYLKAIPRLATLAVEHVDPQDGKVTEIVVRRNFPFSQDVRFRVFVESPRRGGQLDANRFGHPLLG